MASAGDYIVGRTPAPDPGGRITLVLPCGEEALFEREQWSVFQLVPFQCSACERLYDLVFVPGELLHKMGVVLPDTPERVMVLIAPPGYLVMDL
jgi:hypothetical protein